MRCLKDYLVLSCPTPPSSPFYLLRSTSMIHQKLQMLNCCVAEQNRTRALGSSVVTTPSAAAAASKDSGGSDKRRSGSTAPVETMTVPKGGNRGAGGGEAGTVPETAEERSARMRASFAAERDAILRRVGVVKKMEGVASKSDGGGGGGDGGQPWRVIGKGEPGFRPIYEPASEPVSLRGEGKVNQHATQRVGSGDGSTDFSVESEGDGDGLSQATQVGGGRGALGRDGKRRAVARLGGVVRKVGGGAVRKVGGAVWKVSGAVGGKRIRDQGGDRSARHAVEGVGKDGSSSSIIGDGGGNVGRDKELVEEVPSAERVEEGDKNVGLSVERRGGGGDGEENSRPMGEIRTGASSSAVVVAGEEDGGGVVTGERLLSTGGRCGLFMPGIIRFQVGVSSVLRYDVGGLNSL